MQNDTSLLAVSQPESDQSIQNSRERLATLAATATVLQQKGSEGVANTRRGYASDIAGIRQWLSKEGLGDFPITTATLALYLADVYQTRRFTYSTITRQLAAIADWHKKNNATDPQKAPQIADVLNQIKREFGIEPDQSAAIEMDQFREIIASMGNSPIELRDKAILCIGLAGAFRRSELVAVNIEDLRFTNKGVVITLLKSKSNQFGKAEHKAIFKAGHQGKRKQTDEDYSLTCPIAALKTYMALLTKEEKPRTEGPLFVQITHYRPELPYSVTEKRLSDSYVNRVVKQYLGLEYSAHSLRASFVTMAKLAGAQDSEIMQQTKHKSPEMIRRYTRLDDVQKHNAAEHLDF